MHYYLLVNRVRGGGRMYGIRVESGGEVESIRAITPSRYRVQGLLNRLMRGRVTPTAARDVVEDWLLA